MFDPVESISKTLGPWPIAQFGFVVLIAAASIFAIKRGDKDRKTNGGIVEIPVYLVTGPVHDAIMAIHSMAEQIRIQTQLLEEIRNNQEMRSDPPPSHRYRSGE